MSVTLTTDANEVVINTSRTAASQRFSFNVLNYMYNIGILPSLANIKNFAGALNFNLPSSGTVIINTPNAVALGAVNTELADVQFMQNITELHLNNWDRVAGSAYTNLNIAMFSNLQVLEAQKNSSNPHIIYGNISPAMAAQLTYFDIFLYGNSVNTTVITGDFSTATAMKYWNNFGYQNTIKYPVFGNCANLTYAQLGGQNVNDSLVSASMVNLRNATKLATIIIPPTSTNVSSITVNTILTELLAQKQAGGAIATITLTGAQAPTGVGLTAKTTLQGLGVTVTTA